MSGDPFIAKSRSIEESIAIERFEINNRLHKAKLLAQDGYCKRLLNPFKTEECMEFKAIWDLLHSAGVK